MQNLQMADDRAYDGQKQTRLRLYEWMEIFAQSIYPSEQQLEYMLDRIEGTP